MKCVDYYVGKLGKYYLENCLMSRNMFIGSDQIPMLKVQILLTAFPFKRKVVRVNLYPVGSKYT